MTMPDDSRQDDHDYVIYARFCLDLAVKEPDRAHRLLLREMAAAWLNLTDSAPAVPATPPAARPPTDGHSPR
jgi:hypothetical protein